MKKVEVNDLIYMLTLSDLAGAKIGINSDKTIHCRKILLIFILKFATASDDYGKEIRKGNSRREIRRNRSQEE